MVSPLLGSGRLPPSRRPAVRSPRRVLNMIEQTASMATAAPKIKVLVFVTSFHLGGSERQAVELVKNLDRGTFTPSIACLRREGPLLEELTGRVHSVPGFPLTAFY